MAGLKEATIDGAGSLRTPYLQGLTRRERRDKNPEGPLDAYQWEKVLMTRLDGHPSKGGPLWIEIESAKQSLFVCLLTRQLRGISTTTSQELSGWVSEDTRIQSQGL